MAHATRLPRRDATRLTRREPAVQLRTDPELRIRPRFKLPDWLSLASWSFGGLVFSFPTNTVTIPGLVRASSILRTAKKLVQDKITLKFIPIDLNNVVFVSMTEASFGKKPKRASQLEYLTLITERAILDDRARANILELDSRSKKIHRLVKSTLAAESAAMSFVFERFIFAYAVYSKTMQTDLLLGSLCLKILFISPSNSTRDDSLLGNDIALGLATDYKRYFQPLQFARLARLPR